MVASQKMARGDSVNVLVCWSSCSKVKVSKGIKPSPPNGLEPAPLTSEALVAQYLSTYYSLKLRAQIHCPRGEFCKATLAYFQITVPGSSTVTPPYQWRRWIYGLQ